VGSIKCIAGGGTAVTERAERTARGYRRFRCRDCGRPWWWRWEGGAYCAHPRQPARNGDRQWMQAVQPDPGQPNSKSHAIRSTGCRRR